MLKGNNDKGAKSEDPTQSDSLNLGDGSNSIHFTCEKKEGDIYVKLRRFFGNIVMKQLTHIERLQQYNQMGDHNTTGLGARDYVPPAAAFIQKSQSKKGNSLEDMPHYFNPDLNGKGYTHNASPVNRYDTNAEKSQFYHIG